ncbi:hypothetical protein ABMA27_011870 [Loxostege sticticalis]|uniref:Metallo-beta-lactamase domain-containing protein n=1 Tax=Loxostege sticticalis TaxID=481309 RepID=A0ABR3IHW1_LOXSC
MENYKSSFGGEIEEIPNIYVDNFERKDKIAYFLSHAHTDHTVGMYGRVNGENLRINGAKIYMSEETRTILSINHWCYEMTLSDMVEPLKVGMTYSIDLPDGKSLEVTLIPVTHMIGAVMFLFKTEEKTVLYTGDFIMEQEEISSLKKLHDNSGNPLYIDTMYVDATFGHVGYMFFPSRSLCHSEVVNVIKTWLDNENCGVALFHNCQYGYEDMHKEIYRKLGIKLFTGNLQMLNTYRQLYGPANVLTEDSDSKIHICKNRQPDMSHKGCGVSTGNDRRYLNIYVTVTQGAFFRPGQPAIIRKTENSLHMCYPTHCSKSQRLLY